MRIELFAEMHRELQMRFRQQSMDIELMLERLTRQWSIARANKRDAKGDEYWRYENEENAIMNLNKYYELMRDNKQPATRMRYFSRYLYALSLRNTIGQSTNNFIVFDQQGKSYAMRSTGRFHIHGEYELTYNAWDGMFMIRDRKGASLVTAVTMHNAESAVQDMMAGEPISELDTWIAEGVIRFNWLQVKAR